MRYEEIFPQELDEILAKTPIAYVPFGPLEYHDAHLPFGLDALKAHQICLRTCKITGGVVLPPYFLSTNSLYWFTGTIDSPFELVRNVVRNLLDQLKRQGFKTVIVMSGHGAMDQNLAFKAEAELAQTEEFKVISTIEWEFVPDQGYLGEHAAKWETALFMDTHPELVKMERLKDTPLEQLKGIYGEDPRLTSSKLLGQRTIELVVERLAEEIKSVANGGNPKNKERHANWVRAAWSEPLEMVKDSLSLVGNELVFSFFNPHLKSRYITGIRVTINGVSVINEDVRLINTNENKIIQCHTLNSYCGFYIRRLQQCTLNVKRHTISNLKELVVEFEYGGVFHSEMAIKE
jgi:creatinine amidohydrolase